VGERHGHRRLERVAAEHCVGAVPLGWAWQADLGLLALLALTPELRRCSLDGALFLDAETTGLGGAGTMPFLVGLGWIDRDAGEVILEQHLVRDPTDEAVMLERVASRIAAAELLVSYNGKSFDLPLLGTRFVMNRLARPPGRPHLDLLHLARRVHRSRRWSKSLVSVETHVLRFGRVGDVAGHEVAQRYAHYLRSGDDSALGEVVEHNRHDVLSLVALFGLYGEPLDRLQARELADVARAMWRAGAIAEAARVADLSVRRAAAPAAGLRVRARIAKARGDKRQALADFEALAREVDDSAVRLELAKLYEHYLGDPGRALEAAEQGTAETAEAQARRRARLRRKLQRAKGERSGR